MAAQCYQASSITFPDPETNPLAACEWIKPFLPRAMLCCVTFVRRQETGESDKNPTNYASQASIRWVQSHFGITGNNLAPQTAEEFSDVIRLNADRHTGTILPNKDIPIPMSCKAQYNPEYTLRIIKKSGVKEIRSYLDQEVDPTLSEKRVCFKHIFNVFIT